ncbi:MAG: metallophosphoesterase [Lachnospiraceae bacterium]|nr:metallophosphoesterase [Lachnospiraceae bacterium]
MRILIVSDSHGRHENLERFVRKTAPIDMMIHCGDAEGREEAIEEIAGCPLEIVAGNNDFFTTLPKEKEFMVGRYRIFLTHGHYYYISMGPERLAEEAESRGVDIVMCGHTHKPMVERINGLILVNPGSVSYPRQEGRRPSCVMMELDREGEAHFTIIYG